MGIFCGYHYYDYDTDRRVVDQDAICRFLSFEYLLVGSIASCFGPDKMAWTLCILTGVNCVFAITGGMPTSYNELDRKRERAYQTLLSVRLTKLGCLLWLSLSGAFAIRSHAHLFEFSSFENRLFILCGWLFVFRIASLFLLEVTDFFHDPVLWRKMWSNRIQDLSLNVGAGLLLGFALAFPPLALVMILSANDDEDF